MAKRVTITDVARETGVSIKTVSNVLNGTGSMRPETRARVQEAIVRLGYRLNVSARAMKTGGTKLIGLAITDFDQPFMPYLASSVVNAARARGYAVITDTYSHAGGLDAILPETRRLASDGWIFFVDQPFAADPEALRQPYPLVVVGDYDVHGATDWVTMPNVEAVKATVGGLLDAGCRRVALIGGTADVGVMRRLAERAGLAGGASGSGDAAAVNGSADGAAGNDGAAGTGAAGAADSADSAGDAAGSQAAGTAAVPAETTSTLRTRGYCEAYAERGMQVDWRLVRNSDWVQAGGRDAVAQLLDDPDVPLPDAIMCLNDALAIGVIHELQRRGLHVPEDVQVVGFDNVPDAEYCMPGLTTIDPHVDDYARHAVDMLIERIEGRDDAARVYTTAFDLVRRGSTR